MRTFNAIAAIIDALKHHPETHTLPESLQGAEPIVLAEARMRFKEVAQVANELAKLTDAELAQHLQGGAMRYGDTILKPATRGRAKIVEDELWWQTVVQSLYVANDPAALLGRLYPANSLRLTALPLMAVLLQVDEQDLRRKFVSYDPPTATLDATPISKAPKWAQRLSEGQLSHRVSDGPLVEATEERAMTTEELRAKVADATTDA